MTLRVLICLLTLLLAPAATGRLLRGPDARVSTGAPDEPVGPALPSALRSANQVPVADTRRSIGAHAAAPGVLLRTLEGHTGWDVSATWSPDGRLIASTGADGTLRLWRANGTLLKTVAVHPGSWIVGVAWSPDSRKIMSMSDDGSVRLWGADGALLKTLEGKPSLLEVPYMGPTRAWASHWSPNGRLILTPANRRLHLWDSSGNLLTTLEGHTDWVVSASWSPDGRLIVSTGADGTLRLWSANGTLLRQ